MSRATLIFIYNADAGLMHAAVDTLHKWLSPGTYQCQLCRLGYHGFGMRQTLREYLRGLDLELMFLHRDDYRQTIDHDLALPAIMLKTGAHGELLLDAEQINRCADLEHLLEVLDQALQRRGYSQNL